VERAGGEADPAHAGLVIDAELERLRQLIWFDVTTAATAVVVIVATFAFVVATGWLLVLAVVVAAAGATMAMGLRPLARDDLEGAVRWLAAANWITALVATSIATFAWPMMLLAALLPAVIAAPYVPRRRLRWYLVMSLAVAVGVNTLGLLQDFSGFTDQLPSWVKPTIAIFFTPFLAGLVVQTALQNSARLQATLEQTLAANRQLRRSELALSEHARALQASRSRFVAATDRERRRVERDLHDGAQQRLVALSLRLRLAEDLCRRDPEAASAAIAALRDEVHAAHHELRDLAHGVYPSVLTQHGLPEALAAAADRCPLPVDVHTDGVGRFGADLEAAVYFCCVEALQNAAKHAGPDARARVAVAVEDGDVCFAVTDDGVGFDAGPEPVGNGFDNLRDRLGAAGGAVEIHSVPGGGTTVAGRVPVR
jgi:signal transduction histidine kinase